MPLPAPPQSFEIKTGDTAPSIAATLSYADGTVPNLTGDQVRFVMKSSVHAEPPTVNAAATIVDGPTASVRYDWQPGDTEVPGDYLAEWEVEWADGTFETFPSSGYICVTISRDLGGAVTS